MKDALKVIPQTEIGRLLTDRADEAFLRALLTISFALAQRSGLKPGSEETGLVTIPRGGNLVGLASEFALKPKLHLHANDGTRRRPGPLLPDVVAPLANWVVADGIVATGNSAKRVISHIHEHWPNRSGEAPSITLIAPLLSQLCLAGNENLLAWAVSQGITLQVVTAHIEPQAEYITFPLPDGGQKTVLVVGKVYHNERGEFVGAQIGDYGDMTEELTNQRLLETFALTLLRSLV